MNPFLSACVETRCRQTSWLTSTISSWTLCAHRSGARHLRPSWLPHNCCCSFLLSPSPLLILVCLLFLSHRAIQRQSSSAQIHLCIFPGAKPISRPKLLVCGNKLCGKTTLVDALQHGSLERTMSSLISGKHSHSPSPVNIHHSTLYGGAEFSFWDLSGKNRVIHC